jgi:hypothetical protein
MSIDLNRDTVPEQVTLGGAGVFEIIGEKTLKLESSPGGVEYMNETIPAGKVWRVSINISVTETDA